MDLSPERKQQIEEEERRRVAEEQYRAQVRANLNANVASSVSPAHPDVAEPQSHKSRAAWLLLILAVAIIAAVVVISRSSGRPDRDDVKSAANAPPTPSVHWVPVSDKIASGQIVVKARGYVQYRVQITPGMREARIAGSFNASGGSGNDVVVVIAEEAEFTNWINGHEAKVYYSTHGKKTTDNFDVRLGPGTYYFAISNQFSMLSDKYVFLEVALNYQRTETY
jgi:hypothetical protein